MKEIYFTVFLLQGYTTDHGFPPASADIPPAVAAGDPLGSLAGTPAGLRSAGSVGSGSGSAGAAAAGQLGSAAGQLGSAAGSVAGGPHSEQQAILAIEKAYSKPVAFSVRTNVMYDGTLDDDSPVHGCAVR